jgi:serine/threonine-protein phosphatase 5
VFTQCRELRNSGKGGADPLGQYSTNVVATDVLWSDPVREPGLASNDTRGVGLLFGPDVTKRFLESHNLKMIVRSHEGPDARFAREDMDPMDTGFTLDHESEAGAQSLSLRTSVQATMSISVCRDVVSWLDT